MFQLDETYPRMNKMNYSVQEGALVWYVSTSHLWAFRIEFSIYFDMRTFNFQAFSISLHSEMESMFPYEYATAHRM